MAEKCQRLHKSTVGNFWFHFFSGVFFSGGIFRGEVYEQDFR